MERGFQLSPLTEEADRAYAEASSTADMLKTRMLECMRAAESVLQQRERYRRRPNAVNYRDVVHAVLAHVSLDQQTASCLIKALAKTEHAQLSTILTDWLLETNPKLGSSSQVLHSAITAAATSQFLPDAALRFLQLRESYGLPPCLEATNMAITACSHSGRVHDALALLEGMADCHLCPTPYSILMTLQAANFKRKGYHKEALRAIACLPHGAPVPSAILDALLNVFEAAMHKSESLDEVEAMFAELESVKLSDSTRAYNAVLKACAVRGQWELARNYFDRMTAENVPADTHTFNALILSCVKGQALDVALDIFEWLVSGREVQEPIPADITTYNILIHACHQAGLLEKALEISAWVLKAGLQWNSTTFDELMSCVEIAQLWDNKVISSPFYQLKPFCEQVKSRHSSIAGNTLGYTAAGGNEGEAGQIERPKTAFGVPSPFSNMGGVSLSGHPGIAMSMKAHELASSSKSMQSSTMAPPPAQPKTPPMVPLAIFPDQLRPAPFDGLRMMYLDQLKELEEEALLAAVKLNDTSWAARTLTRGGMGPRGKAPPIPLTSAAAALHGQGAFTIVTEGRATKPLLPKLPRITSPSERVHLSPAPSFRNVSLDNVSRMLMTGKNQQQTTLEVGPDFIGAHTPKSPGPFHAGLSSYGPLGGNGRIEEIPSSPLKTRATRLLSDAEMAR